MNEEEMYEAMQEESDYMRNKENNMKHTQGKLRSKYSGKDSRGYIYIDCSECERGGNGSDIDKCSCGFRVKKGGNGLCFLGTLMSKYEPIT